jgi:hypothetical protein
MMRALISGVVARAVLLSGSEVTYIDAHQPTEKHVASLDALPDLLADAYDVEAVNGPTEQQVRDILARKWGIDRALRMLQIALDPNEDTETCEEAKMLLSTLLQRQDVRDGMENIAFSLELARIIGTKTLEYPAFSDDSASVLKTLIAHQEQIATVQIAWDIIPDSLFGGRLKRGKVELCAVLGGCFKTLAMALKTMVDLKRAIHDCFLILMPQQNSKDIIRHWVINILTRQQSISSEILPEEPMHGILEWLADPHGLRDILVTNFASAALISKPGPRQTTASTVGEWSQLGLVSSSSKWQEIENYAFHQPILLKQHGKEFSAGRPMAGESAKIHAAHDVFHVSMIAENIVSESRAQSYSAELFHPAGKSLLTSRSSELSGTAAVDNEPGPAYASPIVRLSPVPIIATLPHAKAHSTKPLQQLINK